MFQDDDDGPVAFNSNKEKGKIAPLRVPYDSFLPGRLREQIDKEVEGLSSLLGVSVREIPRLQPVLEH